MDFEESARNEIEKEIEKIRKESEGLNSIFWSSEDLHFIRNRIDEWNRTMKDNTNEIINSLMDYKNLHWKKFAINKEEIEQQTIQEGIEQEKERLEDWLKGLHTISDFYLLFKDQLAESKLLDKLSQYGYSELKQAHVLDMGCGDGRWLTKLMDSGLTPERAVGIDLYEPNLELAGQLSPPGIPFMKAPPDELPFEDNKFNIILLFGLLMHVLNENLQAAIAAELRRVLANDGIIITFHLNKDAEKVLDPYLQYTTRGLGLEELTHLFPDCSIDFEQLPLNDSHKDIGYGIGVIRMRRMDRKEMNADGA